MKKISVILTTYNSQQIIAKCIDSILNQEGKNTDFTIELIVIDDCSTDETISVINKYDCILLKNESNSGGPNKGRNKGLSIASGDFICIADQDDIWKNDKIKSVLPFLDLAPIITSGYDIIDVKRNKVLKKIIASEKEYVEFKSNETFLKKLSKSTNVQNTYLGSIVFSKELKNILFEEHFGMVDFDWVLRLFHNKISIEICKSLYQRIVDGSNLSLNNEYRKFDFYYSLLTLENYEKQYPKETKQGYLKIHGSRARYYYLVDDMKKARFYFLKSKINLKTLLYYLTTFGGSKIVKKKFNVFG